MKKKLKKYQVAGSPCGEGYQWSADLQMCVPVYDHPIVPLKNGQFDPSAGYTDPKGNFVPYKVANVDALTKGFNYDSDGVYRKAIVTEDKNKQQFSEFFQGLNSLLDLTQLAAGAAQDFRTEGREQDKLNNSRYKKSRYNLNEQGLNNLPAYLEFGGKGSKHAQVAYYPYGGGPLTAEGAKEILTDGTVHGKKLTAKQKRYFGFIAGGGHPDKQQGGSIYTSNPNDPRLQAYKDSLTLYNTSTKADKTLQGFPSGPISLNTARQWHYKSNPTSVYSAAERLQVLNKGVFDSIGQGKPRDIVMPDGTIAPFPARAYLFKKPTQPIIYKKEGQLANVNVENPDLSHQIPTASNRPAPVNPYNYDPNTKTKYSFTTQEGKTLYFPDKQGLQNFIKGARNVSSQEGKDYMTATGYMQQGGVVNKTGYLKGKKTAKNPVNIIPSGNITTEGMAFPIMANGMLLLPDTGDYKFNSNYVVEHPAEMANGGEPKKWIPEHLHKGRCKDMGGPDCPKGSPQYNLALTFKHHHGFHKMQDGGCTNCGQPPEVGSDPLNRSNGMLEQGEVFQQQNGAINKVAEDEPRHESQQGGSPQANVARVLEDTGDKRTDKTSKLLLVKPDEVKAMFDFKPKRSITHSKLYEKVVEKDTKDVKKVEKAIEKNLEYVQHKNGGIYAQNSLDENLKLLMSAPTKQERFDEIYAHQETVKQLNNVDDEQTSKWGGKPKMKYQIGGQDRYTGKRPPYPKTFSTYYDTTQQKQYTPPSWISPEQFYSTPGLIEYMNTLDNLNGVDNDLHKSDDGVWGYRHQAALDKFYPNGQPAVQTPAGASVNTVTQFAVSPTRYTLPQEAQASTVNEGLGWSGGYGNLLGLINSFGRTPVSLEQLDYDPIRLHQEDVRPVINANQSDFNTATNQLSQNGVGYANQANLQAQKYRTDNNQVAAVETRNKAKLDQQDLINAQGEAQVGQANLQLRDQFVNRTLLGKEKQRQQKFEYLNSLFKAIDERNAFNRNANLALQLTPYFNEQGKFNGNKYAVASNFDNNAGQRIEYITDPQTGEQLRVIYDSKGKLISSSKIIGNNKNSQNFKVSLK